MKVAILSESPADEAAVKVLIEALLGAQIEAVPVRARSRGFPAAVNLVAPTLKALHYQRQADALIVVVDSDNSVVHQANHGPSASDAEKCRHCQLAAKIKDIKAELRPIPDYPEIETAIAVAPPSIEAWYLFERDSRCTEAGWRQRQSEGVNSRADILRLKTMAYGTDRPDIVSEKEHAVEHAKRLATKLAAFEEFFPNSIGLLAEAVRNWSVS